MNESTVSSFRHKNRRPTVNDGPLEQYTVVTTATAAFN